MILLLGGQKGGTGKSTLATNIAAARASAGKDVLLIDANAWQGTSSRWAERREEDASLPQLTCIEKSGNIHQVVKSMAEKYDEVIIDTGGQDSKEFRTAMLSCNVLLTPIRPSQMDVETLVHVNELVDTAREMNPDLAAKIVITNAPSHPAIKVVEETRSLLSELEDFDLMNSVIFNRKIYMDVVTEGKGVTEANNAKAKAEIESLIEELFS